MSGSRMLALVVLVAALAAGGLYLSGVFGNDGDTGAEPGPVGEAPVEKGPGRNTPPKAPDGGKIVSTPFDAGSHGSSGAVVGPDTGIRAFGRVENPDGKPLPGAVVELVTDLGLLVGQPQEGARVAKTAADDEGKFSFRGLSTDTSYVLRASHPDYTTERVFPVDGADPASLERVIRLNAGLGFGGKVTDAANRPLAGVTIAVVELDTQSPHRDPLVERQVVTDETGAYRVEHLRPGKKRVLASKAGLSTGGRSELDLQPKKDPGSVDFVLQNGVSIAGIVTDRETGQPLAGAVVKGRPIGHKPSTTPRPVRPNLGARGDDTSSRPVTRPSVNLAKVAFLEIATKADDQGRFVLDGLLDARYLLSATSRGYQRATGVQALAGDTETQIKMVRAASVAGRVVDAASGEPITAFSVSYTRQPDGPPPSPALRQSFAEAKDGAFEYLGAQPGKLYFVAKAAGYAGGTSEPVMVVAGQRIQDLVIPIEKGGALKGLVRDADGKPLARASVTVSRQGGQTNPFMELIRQRMRGGSGHRTTTNARGEWALGNLKPGSYKLKATHPNHVEGGAGPVECVSDQETEAPEIRLEGGGIVTGVVKDEKTGQPDPKAKVMLQNTVPGQPSPMPVATDGQGRYRLAAVKPGIYRIAVIQRNGVMDPFSLIPRPGNAQQTVRVTNGEEQVVDL